MSKKEMIETIENEEVIEQATQEGETEVKENIFKKIGNGFKKHKGKIAAGAVALAAGAIGLAIGMKKGSAGLDFGDCEDCDDAEFESDTTSDVEAE